MYSVSLSLSLLYLFCLEQIELLLEKGCLPDILSLVLAERSEYGYESLMNLILRSASKHTKIECMHTHIYFSISLFLSFYYIFYRLYLILLLLFASFLPQILEQDAEEIIPAFD